MVAGLVVACFAAGFAEGAQYDRFGRRVEPGFVPLVFGPLPGIPWRQAVDFGAEVPIGVDAVAIRRGLGPAFRMIVPRAGSPGGVVDLVVENVQAEDVFLPPGSAGLIPAGSVVYAGTLRGRPYAVVVLSVVNDVLYLSFALEETEWVVRSDMRGGAVVRLDRRPVDGSPFHFDSVSGLALDAPASPRLPGGVRRAGPRRPPLSSSPGGR